MDIAIYPDPVLRYKSVPVTKIDDRLRDVAARMFEVMVSREGVGLAANQIGLPYQIFVIASEKRVFVNPVITKRFSTEEAFEGCLSLPGIGHRIVRAKKIRIRAFDLDAGEIDLTVEGPLARVIQHEYDHLQGVLIIDHIDLDENAHLKQQLRSLEKEFRRKQREESFPDDRMLIQHLDALAKQA